MSNVVENRLKKWHTYYELRSSYSQENGRFGIVSIIEDKGTLSTENISSLLDQITRTKILGVDYHHLSLPSTTTLQEIPVTFLYGFEFYAYCI